MKTMHLSIFFIAFFAFIASCNNASKADEGDTEAISVAVQQSAPTPVVAVKPPSTDSLQMLKDWNGKYPRESKLFDIPAVQQRLQKQLGNERYNFLLKAWAVETPVEVRNNVFIASGCQAHNCDATNFIIIYNFADNTMSVGIREEDKVQLFKEGTIIPAALSTWANEKR
jgi:hypothetical protein